MHFFALVLLLISLVIGLCQCHIKHKWVPSHKDNSLFLYVYLTTPECKFDVTLKEWAAKHYMQGQIMGFVREECPKRRQRRALNKSLNYVKAPGAGVFIPYNTILESKRYPGTLRVGYFLPIESAKL